MIKIPKDFFRVFGTSVINRIIGFLSGVLIARIISKDEYGSYSYVMNIIATAEIFTAMGMVAGTFQLCSENSTDIVKKTKLYDYGSSFGWKFNLVLTGLLVIIAWVFPLPIDGANELLGFAAFIPLTSVLVEFQSIKLRADFRTKEYARTNMIETIFVALFTLTGATICQGKGALLLRTLAYVATSIVVFWYTGTGIALKTRGLELQDKKDLFSVAMVSMINTGLSKLLYLVDIYVIGAVLTDNTAVAAYKIATIIPTGLVFIPASVIIYIYPIIASHKEDMKWVWEKYIKLSIVLFLVDAVLATLLIVFANPIIRVVFGEIYLDAVFSFRLLLINYVITASFKVLIGNIMVMLRRLRYNLFETLLSSCLNILADYYLIKKYSIDGAAVSTVLVTTFISIISFSYLYYLYKKQGRKASDRPVL